MNSHNLSNSNAYVYNFSALDLITNPVTVENMPSYHIKHRLARYHIISLAKQPCALSPSLPLRRPSRHHLPRHFRPPPLWVREWLPLLPPLRLSPCVWWTLTAPTPSTRPLSPPEVPLSLWTTPQHGAAPARSLRRNLTSSAISIRMPYSSRSVWFNR